MRKKSEVENEIVWRSAEQKRILALVEAKDFSEGSEDYLLGRVTSLAFAIVWCEWFLNKKKNGKSKSC